MSPGLHRPHFLILEHWRNCNRISLWNGLERGNAYRLYFSVLSFQKYQSFLKAIFFRFLIFISHTSRNHGFSTTIYRTTFHLI